MGVFSWRYTKPLGVSHWCPKIVIQMNYSNETLTVFNKYNLYLMSYHEKLARNLCKAKMKSDVKAWKSMFNILGIFYKAPRNLWAHYFPLPLVLPTITFISYPSWRGKTNIFLSRWNKSRKNLKVGIQGCSSCVKCRIGLETRDSFER